MCVTINTRPLSSRETLGRRETIARPKASRPDLLRAAQADLVIQTGMDLQQLMGLREDFADILAENVKTGNVEMVGNHARNAITLEQLQDVLFARFPDLEDGKAFRRALAVFDVDGDGWIDFDEFVSGSTRSRRSRDGGSRG